MNRCCLLTLQSQLLLLHPLLPSVSSAWIMRKPSEAPQHFYAVPFQCTSGISKSKSSCFTELFMSATSKEQSYKDDAQHRSQSAAAVDAFHQDMHRVLESRCLADDRDWQKMTRERRLKPTILQSDRDGAERSLVMLKHLRDSMLSATETSYQIVMRAFLSRGRLRWRKTATFTRSADFNTNSESRNIVCAPDLLEELLDDLEQHQKCHDSYHSISIETYNLLLEAYAICSTPRGDRNYAERADNLLRTKLANPSLESYMHVLHAYAWQQANRAPGDCAQKAHEILNDKIMKHTNDTNILMQAHAWVVEAWSKSEGGAEKCLGLLQTMKLLNTTGTSTTATCSSALDAEVYLNTILAWCKAPLGGAAMAHSLLVEMMEAFEAGAFGRYAEPPIIAINSVVTAWGREHRSDKVDEVMRMLEAMSEKYPTLAPNTVLYNSILHSLLSGPLDKDVALQKSLELVEFMENQSKLHPSKAPNAYSYYTLLKCWIQNKGREATTAEESEKILLRMEEMWSTGDQSVTPSNRIYNMVMNAWAKSNHRYAASRALALLERMKKTHYKLRQPDAISYTSVIECLTKSSDPEAPKLAEQLLEEAMLCYRTTKDPDMKPNLRTFTMVIQTHASNTHGSIVRARALLTQLIKEYESSNEPAERLTVNTFPFNYVLNCAANTIGSDEEKMQAFQIASQTFQEIRKSAVVRPDSFSYAFWLKCCNNLLPVGDLRTKCVGFAFEECKSLGLVSEQVLTRLFQGNKSDFVEGLLTCKDVDSMPKSSILRKAGAASYRSVRIQHLPSQWSRNA